ncbi:MAG: hypothetical protein K2Q25_10190 [Mycobacteriaceae bacterium]|nr:hypothetical protein [Mycobacteriaceae bacterium]
MRSLNTTAMRTMGAMGALAITVLIPLATPPEAHAATGANSQWINQTHQLESPTFPADPVTPDDIDGSGGNGSPRGPGDGVGARPGGGAGRIDKLPNGGFDGGGGGRFDGGGGGGGGGARGGGGGGGGGGDRR